MARQAHHDMLPRATHDEDARQAFVHSFRTVLLGQIGPGVIDVFNSRTAKGFRKAEGRDPIDQAEVRTLMRSDGYYQFWSALQRNSQQMMWSAAADTVERSLPDLIERAKNNPQIGSLRLNEELEIPKYNTLYDIHQMPGGYHTDYTKDDVALGAIYDIGVPIYAVGKLGKFNDLIGNTIASFFAESVATEAPSRIVDLGCTIGNSTVPWKLTFPDAEVHGVDVGAPGLRWGHARASAMGQEVHFSQQNAESLDFADNSFDVVTSCLLFHETSYAAVKNILKECHRILKPGGWMIHTDGFADKSRPPREPIEVFLGNWEVYNNNEYFVQGLSKIDMIDEARKAGFADPRMDRAPLKVEGLSQAQAPNGGKGPGKKGYLNVFGSAPTLIAQKG